MRNTGRTVVACEHEQRESGSRTARLQDTRPGRQDEARARNARRICDLRAPLHGCNAAQEWVVVYPTVYCQMTTWRFFTGQRILQMPSGSIDDDD